MFSSRSRDWRHETLGLVPVSVHFWFSKSLGLGLVHLLFFQEVSFSVSSQNIGLADQWSIPHLKINPTLNSCMFVTWSMICIYHIIRVELCHLEDNRQIDFWAIKAKVGLAASLTECQKKLPRRFSIKLLDCWSSTIYKASSSSWTLQREQTLDFSIFAWYISLPMIFQSVGPILFKATKLRSLKLGRSSLI